MINVKRIDDANLEISSETVALTLHRPPSIGDELLKTDTSR